MQFTCVYADTARREQDLLSQWKQKNNKHFDRQELHTGYI